MGSRRNIYMAYIAGFLDGDGSLMLQIKKRSDSKIGIRFMVTICLNQDTRHEKELYKILTTVSGIGPKLALKILSSVSISSFCE